jgi:hypothetical protein
MRDATASLTHSRSQAASLLGFWAIDQKLRRPPNCLESFMQSASIEQDLVMEFFTA